MFIPFFEMVPIFQPYLIRTTLVVWNKKKKKIIISNCYVRFSGDKYRVDLFCPRKLRVGSHLLKYSDNEDYAPALSRQYCIGETISNQAFIPNGCPTPTINCFWLQLDLDVPMVRGGILLYFHIWLGSGVRPRLFQCA